MDEVSVACPAPQVIELRALDVREAPDRLRSSAGPRIIISDHDLFRTVASWYIDDTDNLRNTGARNGGRELCLVKMSFRPTRTVMTRTAMRTWSGRATRRRIRS